MNPFHRKSQNPHTENHQGMDFIAGNREREQNEESVPSQELPNSEFTAELNLFIVFLSLFSLSTEDSLDFVEREPKRRKDGAKPIKRLQKKRTRRRTDAKASNSSDAFFFYSNLYKKKKGNTTIGGELVTSYTGFSFLF